MARRVDGVVVTGRRTDPRPPVEVPVPVPVVYAFQPSQRPDDSSVVVDDAGGAASAVEHLMALRRRRIGHVTGTASHRSAVDRAASAGAATGDALVGEPLLGSWSEAWGREAVDVVLRRHRGLDAVWCGSDQIARGVFDRLRELGHDVPGEVAVAGFDAWDVMAPACRPMLTTVGPELHGVGVTAARLLLEAVEGRPTPGTSVLPTHLVARGSTIGT